MLRAFAAAGVESILLKGASLGGWLYPKSSDWAYLDCDLLIRPADMAVCETTMAELGFRKHLQDEVLPSWWESHSTDWLRTGDGVIVDVHRNLLGVEVDDDDAWQILSESTDTLAVAGYPAPILGLAARLLHVTLHAAQHGAESGKSLEHLERALEQTDDSAWREASGLAARLGAIEGFSAGLELTAAGAELRERLGLSRKTSVAVALRSSTPPPIALGLEQLAANRGLRRRLQILVRKLFPPVEFMRHWDRAIGDSRRALAWAYVRRPFWVVRNTPRGVRAWLAARRRAHEPGS